EIGQKAPDFTLPDKAGRQISLLDFKGQKVIIYFYSKDGTPVCTKQACSFRDAYIKFKKNGVVVIGISKDSVEEHMNFARKNELPFILLADTESEVIKAYSVKTALGTKRTTFVISREGMIEQVFEKASAENNASDILKYLSSVHK
ncbi:MAG: peroxiredoxin, partial [Lachnospiraceae bacterium]